MIRSILFDLDGTLVDTEPTAARVITDQFRDWKIQLDPKDAHYITGRKWDVVFEFLYKKYKLPLSLEEASEKMMRTYQRSIQANLPIIAGAPQAVEHLSQYYQLGLVSGSNREDILWALERLKIRQHFKVILGAEDYPASKPAPDGYMLALHLLSEKGENTLVFEDSQAGITSAINANLWVVAVTCANHLEQDQSKAHYKIKDFTSVNAEWVEKLSLG